MRHPSHFHYRTPHIRGHKIHVPLIAGLILVARSVSSLVLNQNVHRSIRLVDWNFLPLQKYTVTSSMDSAITKSNSFEEEHARQRKIKAQLAEDLCNGKLFDPNEILERCILYRDEHIIVANKPSGVLCVPGVHDRETSLASILFQHFGNDSNRVDRMIVHRLDMHTSGLVIFARTDEVQKTLHGLFRDRDSAKGVRKKYEALICGSLTSNDGEINLPLHRDIEYPPFMRVATDESTLQMENSIDALDAHDGWKKKVSKAPKESLTLFEVIGRELYGNEPVTRVNLTPVTGRTHQLRVHCAAIGHPIVADPAYGYMGEANSNGGFSESSISSSFPSRASLESQRRIDEAARRREQMLCLHAKYLSLPHPVTGASLVFEAPAPF